MNYLTRLHIAIADYKWRKIQARLFSKMKHVGKNVHICPNWKISSPQNMCIGNNVWIGENFFAKAEGNITIGSGTILSRMSKYGPVIIIIIPRIFNQFLMISVWSCPQLL